MVHSNNEEINSARSNIVEILKVFRSNIREISQALFTKVMDISKVIQFLNWGDIELVRSNIGKILEVVCYKIEEFQQLPVPSLGIFWKCSVPI